MENKTVICMKWGDLYPAEYVNVLYNACKNNITGNLKFVCLTNETEGLHPSIVTHPIPEIGLTARHYKHGAWPKLTVFLENLYGLTGRALFIDLDTVILKNIDCFFEGTEEFIAIDLFDWKEKSEISRTGSGIFAYNLGSMQYVIDKLLQDIELNTTKYQNEQDYLTGTVKNISYWPVDWLISFKRHLRQPLILDRFLKPKHPTENAKILAFHGKPRPIDLVYDTNKNWDRFPHYGKGSVRWMQEYWQKYNQTT